MAINHKPAATHANRPYAFGPYDPSWPVQFQEYSKNLREVFGSEIILLEHVGSTSVPGMWAKPQIDIVITVNHFEKIPEYYPDIQARGYKARGDYTSEGEEYFTLDNEEGTRLASVHVLPAGHRWATDLLDVRDYLRAHPKEVEYYSNVKRETNATYPADYTNYYKGKLEAIHTLRERAAKWHGHDL
jgi:GrpB-like predicted nucleotidyltransferase (UPF0157 family)